MSCSRASCARPGNPEFAIGAVDETGWTYLADYSGQIRRRRDYIDREIAAELQTMRRRRAEYTPARSPCDPAGRIVIVVDDGLATGATMIAALHALRARQPEWLVCAVPVAPRDALEKVRPYADELVCLHRPDFFYAVGQFYRHFPQVSDDDVVAMLGPGQGPCRVVTLSNRKQENPDPATASLAQCGAGSTSCSSIFFSLPTVPTFLRRRSRK